MTPHRSKLRGKHPVEPCSRVGVRQPVAKEPLCLEKRQQVAQVTSQYEKDVLCTEGVVLISVLSSDEWHAENYC